MNLYKKIIKKLYYRAFPEMRAQEYTKILSVRVEPETIKISTCCTKATESEYLGKYIDHVLLHEIANQLMLRGLVRVVTKPDHLLNDMVNIEATVCAIYPGDLEEVKK